MIAGKEAIISLEKNSSYEVPRAEKISESENPLEVKYKYKIPACGHRRNNKQRSWQCACSNSNQAWPHDTISSFVGNDYFCDSGNHGSSWSRIINASNPTYIWDGQGCGPSSTCCQFNNPPWFCKNLSRSTTDDLEVRICKSGDFEDTPIELLELYVRI